ncbi:MAG: hypothetical protein JNL58_03225 [Planctomyces sp.]|nr:hypothetical protein [Planctomyces sp.]
MIQKFRVQMNGQPADLTYAELFAAAHRLWLQKNYKQAREVFEQLNKVKDQGPRAAIFLAHCLVMLGDYARCSSVLSNALPRSQYGEAASKLHDTFIFWSVGLFIDVKKALRELAKEHRELPSLSLLLADLMQQSGADELSYRLYRYAIRHDHPNGPISLAAQNSLKKGVRTRFST